MSRSITLDLAFYIVITLAGYLSNFNDTPDLIVSRAPPPGWEKDYLIIFARIAVAGAVCITIPLNFVAMRTAVFNHLFTDQELTTPRYSRHHTKIKIGSC
ncbi:MAG: hypothetical protein P4M11_07820 [Candidatus Pacebacteria bacterium]|nr:hypothetical protein [Candidatus Paceibacterota bacterium]